ncbi:PaaI family thioesterase [Gordonia sp. (in: high G+C Gram-positive bacteria)]|uniref:PaaI family thioesterase n=1 Tax=Gordonia sp. (in: high G+C Gram-positive bacteria) TaxID=84139 RepID=UPI0035293EEB
MATPSPHDPFSAFAVGRRPGAAPAEMVQYLGPGLTDHRGLIDLPALTVLFDDIGGLPFFAAGPGSAIQARLSMSMNSRPGIDEILRATAELVMNDDGFGVTTVRISGDGGRAVCVGEAHNVRVDRDLVTGDDGVEIGEPTRPESVAVARAVVDPNRSGRDIVGELVADGAGLGPFARLLGGAVEFDGEGDVLFSAAADPWTANLMGTMHGGVIAAIAAQGLSLAAQAAAPAGADYQLTAFTIAFLRSPAVDGRRLTARTRPVRVGRRLGVFDADLYDGDRLLAHAVADARYLTSPNGSSG